MSIVITGNPGVGKHTITKKISKKLNLPIIDINIIAKDSEVIEKRENTNDVDTQKLAIIVKEMKLDGKIVVGNTMKITLACDHRVVDGATGSAFLSTLRNFIENPVGILL